MVVLIMLLLSSADIFMTLIVNVLSEIVVDTFLNLHSTNLDFSLNLMSDGSSLSDEILVFDKHVKGTCRQNNYKLIECTCVMQLCRNLWSRLFNDLRAQPGTPALLEQFIRSLFRQYWQPNIKHTIHKEIQ